MESNTTEITTLITENLPNCTKEDPGYILISAFANRYKTRSYKFDNMTIPFSKYLSAVETQCNGMMLNGKRNKIIENNSNFLFDFLNLCNYEIEARKGKFDETRKDCEKKIFDDFMKLVSLVLDQSLSKTFDKSEILNRINDNDILTSFFSISDAEYEIEEIEMSYCRFLNKCKEGVLKNRNYFNEQLCNSICDLYNEKVAYEQGKAEEKINQKKESRTDWIKTTLKVGGSIGGGALLGYFLSKLSGSNKNKKKK